jgi:hypothetical protein
MEGALVPAVVVSGIGLLSRECATLAAALPVDTFSGEGARIGTGGPGLGLLAGGGGGVLSSETTVTRSEWIDGIGDLGGV